MQIGRATGKLRSFIVEPFVAHEQSDEAYVCIYSHRKGDTILFTPEVTAVPFFVEQQYTYLGGQAKGDDNKILGYPVGQLISKSWDDWDSIRTNL